MNNTIVLYNYMVYLATHIAKYFTPTRLCSNIQYTEYIK